MKALPIARIRFKSQSQEGPGINSSGLKSCWDDEGGKSSRHKVWWHPWFRGGAYWVELYDRNPLEQNAELLKCAYVLASEGDVVYMVDGPMQPPVRGPGRPPKK